MTELYELYRPRPGPRKFKSPGELWDACKGYFVFMAENPVLEHKPFHYQGQVTVEQIPHPRTATLHGLCPYLGIGLERWRKWGRPTDPCYDEGYAEVVRLVEGLIFEWNVSRANAGVLDANLTSRLLGLVERQEQKLNATVDATVDQTINDRSWTTEELREELVKRGLPPPDDFQPLDHGEADPFNEYGDEPDEGRTEP